MLLAGALGVPVGALDGGHVSVAGLAQVPGDVPAAGIRRQALLHRADILSALTEDAASQSARSVRHRLAESSAKLGTRTVKRLT